MMVWSALYGNIKKSAETTGSCESRVTIRQVSNFLQSAARSFTDVLADEIQAASDDMRELLEFNVIWGTADENVTFTGDTYQYNGIYPWILKDDPTNCVTDVRGAKIALSNLDDALDVTRSKYQNLKGGKWLWLMSSPMRHAVSGLQTKIQRLVPQINYEGQFLMDTYEGVPIMDSGFVAPNSTSASVAGLGVTAAGSGAVAAGTYYYRIAAITLYGEQVASAGAQVTQGGASAQTNLSWTANSDAKLYAVYRGALNGADTVSDYQLLDIIAGKAYNSSGVVTGNVATYTDAFTLTKKANVHPLVLYSSSSKAMESIFLVFLDKLNGASLAVLPPAMGETYGGDPTKNLVRFNTLVETTSSFQFRLESFHALQIANAKVCAVIRGAQVNATS